MPPPPNPARASRGLCKAPFKLAPTVAGMMYQSRVLAGVTLDRIEPIKLWLVFFGDFPIGNGAIKIRTLAILLHELRQFQLRPFRWCSPFIVAEILVDIPAKRKGKSGVARCRPEDSLPYFR